MPDRCVIIGSAPQADLRVLQKAAAGGGFLICADGGYKTCLAAGLIPDLFVGDGDSSDIPANTEKIVLPAEKDETDLQAAINAGLARGYKDFILTGCTGNRFDHYYAAVCMLEYLYDKGAAGSISDGCNMILFHKGGTVKYRRRPEYKYISVAPLDGKITGVTLKGLKYPLSGATLYRTQTVGISNEFIDDDAEIKTDSGRALIIYSKDLN